MINKMKIKKGDTVIVIAGKDNGKKGKVVKSFPKDRQVIVEGVNVVTKHQKPKSAQDNGGLIKKEMPIDVSNVMIICAGCGSPSRIGIKVEGEKKSRFCKKCGKTIANKAAVKTKTSKEAAASKEEVKEVKKAPAKKTSAAKEEK